MRTQSTQSSLIIITRSTSALPTPQVFTLSPISLYILKLFQKLLFFVQIDNNNVCLKIRGQISFRCSHHNKNFKIKEKRYRSTMIQLILNSSLNCKFWIRLVSKDYPLCGNINKTQLKFLSQISRNIPGPPELVLSQNAIQVWFGSLDGNFFSENTQIAPKMSFNHSFWLRSLFLILIAEMYQPFKESGDKLLQESLMCDMLLSVREKKWRF